MKRILRNSLELLMLATIAITQPIFDLYGKNLPIFASAKISKYELTFFICLVAIAPFATALVIETVAWFINKRLGTLVHEFFIFLFGTIFGLALVSQLNISYDAIAYVSAVAIGASIVWGLRRLEIMRTFVMYLSGLAPLLTVIFVFQIQPVFSEISPTMKTVAAPEGKPPVVLIVFDESPLFALLDKEGKINPERFPGFAKLVSLSTWHRNATAVSQQTIQAVPAIFTSRVPKKGDQPFLSDHPDNIFTMLESSYPINGYESVTSLCPRNLCSTASAIDLERVYLPRVKSFLSDALVVFGHRMLPSHARSSLPSIGQAWGGFAQAGAAEGADADHEAADAKFLRNAGSFYQLRMWNGAMNRMMTMPSPSASILHFTVPHRPWSLTPNLHKYYGPRFLGDFNPKTGDLPKDYYQRYLYQLTAVDHLVDTMITRMQAAGLWDKSLVMITADHGISFEPGLVQRATDFSNPGQVTDLYTIPMFIKMPFQKTGVVDDCAVTNLDLLPTLLDVTGIKTSLQMEGESLVDNCPQRELRAMTTLKESRMLASSFDLVRARSDRYAQWLPREGPVQRIAGELSAQEILGSTVKTVPSTGAVATWTSAFSSQFDDVKPGITELAPTFIFGTIDVREKIPETTDGLVLIDGKVAGVINELSGAAPGEIDYQVLLDYTLLTPGKHVPTLVLRHRVGLTTQYELVGPLG
ncbi:MAG: sulfatase-like hydrolase/transferase [Actinobacteria bacterium]|uniref:Unannotated protein n=1 Tax=freshwater metagenome TaxID=449393 RepID=A0A6J6MFB9_9ZZZZ|nr:sulfatase-like hydrolase/transferase [Actinomycetota bacterium]